MTTARLFFAQFLFWLFMATNPASAGANLTMADLQNGIGDGVTKGLYQEGDLAHAALHGLVGCAAAEALDGNCASGAAAAIAQSLYAGTQNGTEPKAGDYVDDDAYLAAHAPWKANISDNAQLIGASVGYITSAGLASNVSNGGSIAQSGADNNYLNHTQRARVEKLIDELNVCNMSGECSAFVYDAKIAELQR